MKGFLWKLRSSMQRFMTGRHGSDQLSVALLWFAVIINLIGLFVNTGILSLISLAALVFSTYRMFSKNNQARYKENAWFLKTFGNIPSKTKQLFARIRNARKFVYFDCPQCHAKLRLPRGVGNVTVKCGKCGNSIHKKA
ncbi:MAG: hypothetical protein Q4D04_00290 [Clostridia bacterium]|nr:hypothetical protein [Clostridia bacterium]